MSRVLIILPSGADAHLISAHLWGLADPIDDRAPGQVTQMALPVATHPETGEQALVVPLDWSMPVSATLKARPERADLSVISGLVSGDPQSALQAVLAMDRVSMAQLVQMVDPARVLDEQQATDAGWIEAGGGD